jgi:menaquinone-dependent protoporphyrinogen IX oxidase
MERRTFFKLGLVGISSMALADKAWALKYYPNPSDKKWAVLYGTWCGSSRDAGVWISEGMGGIADVFDVRENPNLKGFDHIVIGSSIRDYKINPLMEKYINKNKGRMKGKIRGFYVVCGNLRKPPGPEQIDMYIDKQLAQLCGVGKVPAKVFNGRITMGLLDKQAFELMTKFGVTDYDDLKRADCLAFGKEILASMK